MLVKHTKQPADDTLLWTHLYSLMTLLKTGIKWLHNSMGSQHLDSWRLPLKFKTIIKLRGITMINSQDNEKQMVSLVQKISTATLQSFVTFCYVHSSPVNSAEPGLSDNGWLHLAGYITQPLFRVKHCLSCIMMQICCCQTKCAVCHAVALFSWMNRVWYEEQKKEFAGLRRVSACRHFKSARAFGNINSIKSWAVVQVTVGISGKGRRTSQSACFWVFKVKWPDICFVGAVKGETKTLKYNSLRYGKKTMLPNWSCCSWIIYSLCSPLDGTIYLSRNESWVWFFNKNCKAVFILCFKVNHSENQ